MDFTREPIIETVITPKEGCKLVVRSSKSTGQEEYFVDAVEVVSFGHSFFFRSQERPKSFFVPATDYEILEVREARMVLKNVGIDRTIKIAGGREGQMRSSREREREREPAAEKFEPAAAEESAKGDEAAPASEKAPTEQRLDKKRDRRRNYRRRRGRDGALEEGEEGQEASGDKPAHERIELPEPVKGEEGEGSLAQQVVTSSILTSLLPPPPTLISETIARYKDNVLFKDAFYTKEEPRTQKTQEPAKPEAVPPLPQPEYGSFEMSEEEEEEIYQQRKQLHTFEEESPNLGGQSEEHQNSPSNHSAEIQGDDPLNH